MAAAAAASASSGGDPHAGASAAARLAPFGLLELVLFARAAPPGSALAELLCHRALSVPLRAAAPLDRLAAVR